MASILPPSPQGVPPGHPFWNQWYEKLRVIINNVATSFGWVNLNFAGSKIQDIVDRQHNNLTSLQGGTAGEYYHLTAAQYSSITTSGILTLYSKSGDPTTADVVASTSKLYKNTLTGNTKLWVNDAGTIKEVSGGVDLSAIPFVTLATSTSLSNERVLTAGTNISIVDGGAGNPVTVNVAASDITGVALPMTITPKAPTSTETPGTLTLRTQNAVGSGISSGDLRVETGNGENGGNIIVQAGTGVVNAGFISFVGGSGGQGGSMFFQGGNGVNGGGNFSALAGDASGVEVQAGLCTFTSGSAPNGYAGDISFITGLGAFVGGGRILMRPGGSSLNALEIADDGSNSLIGLYGVTPVTQPTTSTSAATAVIGVGTSINTATTFDGYTVAQVVKALRDIGVLA